jgi:hypothetical protein
MVRALVVSLILTILFEAGIFLLIGKRKKKDLLLVMLVNVITNPVVVLSYWLAVLYTNWNHVLVTMLLELFAVLTEGYYYKKYGQDFGRPYLFSAAANAFSFGTGVLLQIIF